MKIEFSKNVLRAAVAGSLLLAGSAFAASDGTLGLTSSGETDVQVTIGDYVQISSMDDIDLGNYLGTGDLAGSEEFCVYRKTSGIYRVQVSSANAGAANEFRVVDNPTGTNFINYSVEFDDDTSVATAGNAVVSGDIVANQAGHGTQLDCGGNDNARVDVSFLEADLQAAPASVYADTITLTVSPI